MSRRIAAAVIALSVAAIVALAAQAKKAPMWRCSTCGAMNDAGRSYCMNGCGVAGPLAPRRVTS